MKFKIKSLSKLEEELSLYRQDWVRKTLPAVLVDTGALIDVERSIRDRISLKKETKLPYNDASFFLSSLNKRIPLVITPHVFGEITEHSYCMINSHTPEIEYPTFEYIKYIINDSTDFLTRNRTDIPSDDARYDTYWITQESCKDNGKKCNEEFSEADKDILTNSLRLSRSHIEFPQRSNDNYNINPVIILSSDQHLSMSVKFINEFLSHKYPNIISISTRYLG